MFLGTVEETEDTAEYAKELSLKALLIQFFIHKTLN